MVRTYLKHCFFCNLCTIFIRPCLEYASIVGDDCSKGESPNLEALQLDAASIVAELEPGWKTGKKARKHNLVTLYKIFKKEFSDYFFELFPMYVCVPTNYPLHIVPRYVELVVTITLVFLHQLGSH